MPSLTGQCLLVRAGPHAIVLWLCAGQGIPPEHLQSEYHSTFQVVSNDESTFGGLLAMWRAWRPCIAHV